MPKLKDNGVCHFGDMCNYAHSIQELKPAALPAKYKTTLCRRLWEKGTCSNGDQCSSSHNLRPNEAEICRFFMPMLKKNGIGIDWMADRDITKNKSSKIFEMDEIS